MLLWITKSGDGMEAFWPGRIDLIRMRNGGFGTDSIAVGITPPHPIRAATGIFDAPLWAYLI